MVEMSSSMDLYKDTYKEAERKSFLKDQENKNNLKYEEEEDCFKKWIKKFYGIGLSLISSIFSVSANYFLIKSIFFNGIELVAIRNTYQLIIMIIVGIYHKHNLLGPKGQRKYLFIIGLCGSISSIFYNFSIKLIDPSDTMALWLTSIIMISIMAKFILKEEFNIFHIISLILIVGGVFLIAQPSFIFNSNKNLKNITENDFDFNYTNTSNVKISKQLSTQDRILNYLSGKFKNVLVIIGIVCGILSAFGTAVYSVLIKKLANKSTHFSIFSLYISLVSLPISILIASSYYLTGGQKDNFELIYNKKSISIQIFYASGAAFSSLIAQLVVIIAHRYEDASKISMYRTLDLFFTYLMQYFILNKAANTLSLIGYSLILIGSIIVIIYKIIEKKINENKNQI